ncbi:MAG: DUF11 domain-containing protein [Chloracidobacterium sp.]|nr:DUF11 domain-containing protein [Chloracidobacterium sp.]
MIFNGAGVQQTIAGTSTFNNLTINHTGAGGVSAVGSTLDVTGLMRVQSGKFTSATSYNNVQIDADPTANLSLSGPITVSGNWTNSNALAGFTANGSGVTFNGGTGQTLTGDTTFFDLTKTAASPQTMNFTAGSTTTVTGALTLTGTAGNLLALRSTAPGTQWNLKATPSQSVGYVDAQDSNALSGSPIAPTNSVNAGNNLNWAFVQAPVVYVDPAFTGTPGTDPDGAGPATSIGYDAFATIQGGVNGVADGGQVIVNAGTYSESNNTINLTKSVRVTGPNAAISPNTGSRVAEAVVTSQGTSMSPNGVFRLDVSTFTVTIEGLKFDGTAAAINAYAPNNSISLKKNIFTASHDPGMYFETPNLTIDDNRFVDITSALTEDVIAVGTNVGTNRSPVSITNNVWINVAAGALNLDKISGTISGNQFVNVQYYGILVVHDSGNLNIRDNLFNTITNPDPVNVPTWGAGVRFYEPAVTSPVNITGNTFKNSHVGVGIRGVPNDPGANITGQPIGVHFNRFFSNNASISNGAAGTLAAENNWWGCNAGPNNAGCGPVTGNVAFTPWIVLRTTASPTNIIQGGTSDITADLRFNSANVNMAASGTIPNVFVAFTATEGTISPTPLMTTLGVAQSLFTSTSGLSGTACSELDNSGPICTNIIVVPQANLAITKTDNVSSVIPGGPVTYVIVASNGGPNAVAGAVVTDIFPADVTGVTWTCSGTGTCAASGVGNINDNTVALAPGQTVTYTASGTVSPGVGPTISNTAAVSPPAGTVDPDTMNNSATDTDAVEALMQFSSPLYREDESQTAQILITRSGGTLGISSINFSTVAGGTATPGATGTCGTAGVDYETVTNQLVTFVANDTEKIVTVKICGDTSAPPEIPDETIGLQLTPPVPPVADNGGGARTTAVLNINDTASQFLQSPVHTSIDMNFATTANPYPSQIVVAGAPNIVGTMRVTLYDISHASPDNMDVLLVGPLGQKYLLVADTGGPFPIDPAAPVTLTFSDFAGGHLLDSGAWTTGQFLPTVCESNSVFAPTAPGGPYVTPNCSTPNTLAQTMFGSGGTGFGLTNPNGTWSLYVRDDAGQLRPIGDDAANFAVGRIAGGWGLEFLAPTSADVSIGGRVLTDTGRGIRGAVVTVTGNSLVSPINVMTGVNGRYTVPGLTAGETYVVTVRSRRFFFTEPSRVITLNDNVADADFISTPTTTREQ